MTYCRRDFFFLHEGDDLEDNSDDSDSDDDEVDEDELTSTGEPQS